MIWGGIVPIFGGNVTLTQSSGAPTSVSGTLRVCWGSIVDAAALGSQVREELCGAGHRFDPVLLQPGSESSPVLSQQ